MSGKRGLGLVLLVVGLVGPMSSVGLTAVWDNLLTLSQVDADPNKSYLLTEANGPWTILACSFSGERGSEQARELVLELRKRYKLPAYLYEKQFDLTEGAVSRGFDKYGSRLRVNYRQGTEVVEVAVLVGDYTSVDDPEAQKTLRKLKYSTPDCLKLDADRPTSRTLAAWRVMQQHVLAKGNMKKQKGPMGHALITTNPLLPKDFFVAKGLDPLIVTANEGVTHGLLDCPGQYTVQVATFTGRVVIDQQEIAAIQGGKKMTSKLAQAAEDAHRLTEALRQKGYEAFEFHDRYASIVTVGSFDWANRDLPNGRKEMNPEIQHLVERFGPRQTNLGGQTGGLAQQTLLGIPFDLRPLPVHVPRRSIGDAYSQGAKSLF